MECTKLLKTKLNKYMLYYEGFSYNIHSSEKYITRWRLNKRTCTGFLHSDRNLVVINKKWHNHDATLMRFTNGSFTPYCQTVKKNKRMF
jgi:hypothetical protein